VGSKNVINDATASVNALVFQFCVAVEQCFRLKPGEKLWIEKFGDVTSQNTQIEVKHVKNDLTDGHESFWKTIKNWCDPSFDHTLYSSLVLLTTQKLGAKASLGGWNNADGVGRIDILENILKKSERTFRESKKKKKHKAKSPTASLIMQKAVMAKANRKKLEEVAKKVHLSFEYDGVEKLCAEIKSEKCRAVLEAKKDDFMDGIYGFVSGPSSKEDDWEITYDDFNDKIISLYKAYGYGTRSFPQIHRVDLASIGENKINENSRKNYFKKIVDIELHENKDVIVQAVGDYSYANNTVLKDFIKYQVSAETYNNYASDLASQQKNKRLIAKNGLKKESDPIGESQLFYLKTISDNAQNFSGFDATPISFRNGVYHMLADEKDEIVWRLW
jgi:hypothetical protein